MACELKPACDFFSFLQCSLPRDTIDVALTVRTVQGIQLFRKDHTVETANCSPWSIWMKLFPPLQKKIKAYKVGKKDERGLFHPIPYPFTKRSSFSKRSRNNMQKRGKSKIRRLDMSKFAHPRQRGQQTCWFCCLLLNPWRPAPPPQLVL